MFRSLILILIPAVLTACSGEDRPAGTIEGPRRSDDNLSAHADWQAQAEQAIVAQAGPRDLAAKQVLFGDLHVHTTYSIDAFAVELPMMGQQGMHTPADACDFARYCAKLDFYSTNDHAESLTPEHWSETKRIVRECNALGGPGDNQDLVVFSGWEWTQVGVTADKHWGHKNVIFPGTAEDELPARPINSRPYGSGIGLFNNIYAATNMKWLDPFNWKQYAGLELLLDSVVSLPECPRDVPSPQLPLDCHENAPEPRDLFRKLDEWGFDTLVIPHGNAWGSYTPPKTKWDKQLNALQHDPVKQSLVEVFSGHGNSEEYREFRAYQQDEQGIYSCPQPADGYTACCWQAGEIMRSRCGDLPSAECESRVELAKQYVLDAGAGYSHVIPDAQPEEWLNCGVCEDCFKPAFNYVPTESTQYALALGNFDELDENGKPLRFDWGFVGATDDHTARPGTGYKQYERRKMTFASGVKNSALGWLSEQAYKMDDPQMPQQVPTDYPRPDGFRMQTFTYPGGIVAVHSNGRSREAIWDAMKRRETYATSGPRMLLWFDLLNGPEGRQPMGTRARLPDRPRFEVRATGAFKQKPGCPADALGALEPERLEYLCAGECYHPGDERHPITHIEVVRIQPQVRPDESIGELVEDVWKRIECEPDPQGCVVQFEDEGFLETARDTIYYVRALQEPTPAINGEHIRTTFDANGDAIAVNPCYGDYRTPLDDDCLAPAQERAWSSPIYVDHVDL
jgi:hypothetical protein